MAGNHLNARCPICMGNGHVLRKFTERRGEVLKLLLCEKCASEFLFPLPSSAWSAEEYAHYFSKRQANDRHPKRAYFAHLLLELNIGFSDKKVVDVGAAEGDLIYAIKKKWPTADAYAIERVPESVYYFSKLPCTYYNDDIVEWLGKKIDLEFDCIFMLDLLEHLSDPSKVVKGLIQKHLTPSGWIIGTFPTVSSISRKVLAQFWPQYKVEHLLYPSERGIRHIEKESGLNRLRLVPLKKRLPLSYLLQVGGSTGPPVTKKICYAMNNIIPQAFGRVHLSIMSGEYLWIAQKK